MIYNYDIWWKNIYGPSKLISDVVNEINSRKNVIISCKERIPWINHFFEEIIKNYYDFKVDDRELILEEIDESNTILKEILELNGIGYQYKGEKISLKYLDGLESDYIKLYYIKKVPESRKNELFNLMRNMSNNTKVLIIAIFDELPAQTSMVKVNNYYDYIKTEDNIRLLNIIKQSNNYPDYIQSYIAELVGRISDSLEDAVDLLTYYKLGNSIDYSLFDDEKKKLVWEAQLISFFPIIEKARASLISKYYNEISKLLPIKDIFGYEYSTPEELEIGHLMRLMKGNSISFSYNEQECLNIIYDFRNMLAHQRIISEEKIDMFYKRNTIV